MNNYIENKYYVLYNLLILTAKNEKRIKGSKIYYESHHIIPKSFGGSDDSTNLVLLTGREHYLCHYLLTKFTQYDELNKMIYAFNFMNINQNHKINSKLYEANRIKHSKLVSEKHKGKLVSDVTKKKIGLASKGRYVSDDNKFNRSINMIGDKNHFYGKHHSDESKYKLKVAKSIGIYYTPWGDFISRNDAVTDIVSDVSVRNWCKVYPDKTITNNSITKSDYLKSLKPTPLGKTFRDIGFYYEEKN